MSPMVGLELGLGSPFVDLMIAYKTIKFSTKDNPNTGGIAGTSSLPTHISRSTFQFSPVNNNYSCISLI